MTRPQHGSRYPHGPRPGHWARRSDSLDRDGNAHGADDAEDTVEMDADRQRLAMGPLPDRVPRPPVVGPDRDGVRPSRRPELYDDNHHIPLRPNPYVPCRTPRVTGHPATAHVDLITSYR